jgi:cell division septation protein DedD
MITYTHTNKIGVGLLTILVFLVLSLRGLGQEDGSSLSISRTIEKVGERQYRVEVTLQKGGLKGYAKLEEMIPKGFVASKEKTRGASYIFQDGKAKFIWMEFPKNKEFQVIYKLIQKQSEAGEYKIDGRLSCVSADGELLRVEKSSSFEVEAPEAPDVAEAESPGEGENSNEGSSGTDSDRKAASANEDLAKNEEEVGEDPAEGDRGSQDPEEATAESVSDGGKAEAEENEKEPSWEEDAGSESASTESVHFSVQIGAFGEKKSDAYFERRYGLGSDKIHHYREGALHKYSTGRFGTYDQANEEKKRLRKKGLKGAFVIGFKGGKAVSVSALR